MVDQRQPELTPEDEGVRDRILQKLKRDGHLATDVSPGAISELIARIKTAVQAGQIDTISIIKSWAGDFRIADSAAWSVNGVADKLKDIVESEMREQLRPRTKSPFEVLVEQWKLNEPHVHGADEGRSV